jgi:osmotically inducible lipoprotein OsmB
MKVNLMNTKILAAVAAAAVMGLSGCANMDRQTAGTVGGAAAGAYIGNQATKPAHRY